MAEVLSSGRQPHLAGPRRPRPRWLSVLTVLAVASVLTVLAIRDGSGRRPAPEVASGPPAAVEPRPSAVSTGPLPPEAVYRLDGDPGPGPAGVRLLVAGWAGPAVLDAGTGTVVPLPGLRAGPDAAVDLHRGGGLTTGCVFSRQHGYPRGWVLPDGGRPTDLGRVQDVLPMRDGTVLTLVCLAGTDGGCVLGSRTGTGRVRWQRRLPSGLGLVRDTSYGLLTVTYLPDGPGVLRLEDPRTGRVVMVLSRAGHPLAATDRLVAYQSPDCESSCPVLLVDLATGSRRSLPVLEGRAGNGAFSPDERRLAVGFTGLHSQDPVRIRQRDGYLAVLDLDGGGWQRAPGLTTAAKTAPVPVWLPGGTLLVGTGHDGAGRVAWWRPGAGRLTVLPVRLAGFYPHPSTFLLLA